MDFSVNGFDQVLREDAREVARRTLRYKFGRLSNRRILGVLRTAAAGDPRMRQASDAELLDLWFGAYADSLRTLRSEARQAG
ncbi:MAG TPA: hypothetical protein VMD91_18665 [Candidatus Sulfotelmatobacter sp.]|nr:hypothetical protein [Candidatus Sulfotelmatobacter sp.]